MNGSMVFARWHQCALYLIPLRTRVHNPNVISIGLAIFAQLTAECRRACSGMSFSLKIAPSHGAMWTPI